MLLLLSLLSITSAFPFTFSKAQLPLENTFGSCPKGLPASCTNSTPINNECCFESPGGVMLQTQFWDYYPPIGDNDTFTLHGLWPDNCDGTYEQFCDNSLELSKGEIKRILTKFDDQELYNKMEKVWKNFNGDDESLWIHEFNKHATCIKTIRPKCYSDYQNDENVYDFFKISVGLYEKYPTFDFLAQAGIHPSLDATYTKQQIADALNSQFSDKTVYFKCNKYNALQEIWYFHHLKGSLLLEEFIPIDALTRSSCPETGIKFLPKGKFSPPPGQPPKDPSGRRGYLRLSDHAGCLISNGQHYEYGTCATFRIADSQFGGKNLLSSKGVCGFDDKGDLTCNRSNSRSKFQFQFDKESKTVGFGGNFKWCFDTAGRHGHGKYIQTPVKLSDGDCEEFSLKLA
ncbi:hypothetical protein C7M61_002854 [Candidozyma pseudohaemuli]|uniref:Ribonuclease T2-like n=1 Tax=Candidozyma pseudohaemuli TaxID=418784 RepID=A0A2P7YQQ6_9ASCO|nr:hypothetical protein C7M61_002854 [[Candida] pseudohaemulonii]PSK38295.1 hypothetical protein C7M61_002854 [[Candida] pseudohaemulonii]